MNPSSTIDQARNALALAPDSPPTIVLRAATERIAQYSATQSNARLPKPKRDGAARQLEKLSPLLPALEIEGEMHEIETGLAAPGSRIHLYRLRCEKLAALIQRLPAGDERAVFEAQLRDLAARLGPAPATAPTGATAPVPSLAPTAGTHAPPTARPPAPAPFPTQAEAPVTAGPQDSPIGTLLKLQPWAPEGTPANPPPTPLHFVARPAFVLGRLGTQKPSRTDFSCPPGDRYRPVGRVNATLSRRGDKIFAQDGGGGSPSTNGSLLDETPLSPAPSEIGIWRPHAIGLAGVFTVQIRHLPGSALGIPPQPEDAENRATTDPFPARSAAGLTGCLIFEPKPAAAIPATVVWLFTDATIGSATAGAVMLPDVPATLARIHHVQDSFWIESLDTGMPVSVSGRPLALHETGQLRPGEKIELGAHRFVVEVEP